MPGHLCRLVGVDLLLAGPSECVDVDRELWSSSGCLGLLNSLDARLEPRAGLWQDPLRTGELTRTALWWALLCFSMGKCSLDIFLPLFCLNQRITFS